ncbi:MAG TPA: TauD/TfdA family dioxygenase [Candidatus Angelobacter sp.]
MPKTGASPFRSLEKRERRAVQVSSQDLVAVQPLLPGRAIPMAVRPAISGVDLCAWATENREFIEQQLFRHGALLFRGFGPFTPEQFERFAEATSTGGLIDYQYASTPRHRIKGRIYSSTEYPPDQAIPMHNEMSYAASWPGKIWFCCLKASLQGGETPIADSARVLERIDASIQARFQERGVSYVRNYRDHVDLSYANVFGTEDRAEIEKFCQTAQIECEFGPDRQLRTRQRCSAIAIHPGKKRPVWFNQAHLFHISSLEPAVADSLLSEFGEAGLPRNAYYGDGSKIETSDLDAIREAYRQEMVVFSWNEGDILMLDNMRVAHGRQPFSGERKVIVAMAEQISADAPSR